MSARPWAVLAVVLVGTFLGGINNSAASVMLPSVLESFPGTSVGASGLLLTAYIYPTAVMVPLAGRLQDRFGVRPMYVGGLLACACASLLCAAAPSYAWLIVGRVLQGLSLASVLPTVFEVAATFPSERRGRVLGVWAAVNGGSLAAGPLLGGLLILGFGWRGVFAFDVVMFLAAFALAYRMVPPLGARDRDPIDYTGAALLVGTLLGLLTTLSLAGDLGITSPLTLCGLAATVATAIAWYASARRRPDPFLDPGLFRGGTFGVLNAIVGLQMVVLFGIFFAVPLMLVFEHDVSNARAGVIVALTPLAATVLAPFAGRLADRAGTRLCVLAGGLLLCVAGAALAGSVAEGGAAVIVGLVVAGAGISLIQSPTAAEVTRVAEGERSGLTVGIFNAGRLINGALGTALFTLVFQLAGSVNPGVSLDAVPRDALLNGFRAVFVGMSLAGALALALAVVFGGRFWRPR